jgi:Flp pilus assembly protein TadD
MAGHPVRQPRVCGVCGAKNRPDWRRCQRCHADLAERPSSAPAVSSGTRAVPWPLAAALAVAAVVVAAAVWPRAGTPPAAPPTAPPAVAADAAPQPVAGERDRPPTQPASDGHQQAREAVAAYQRGDFAAALQGLEQAVAANPADASALNNLGQTLVRLGRPAEALVPLQKAATLAPESWAYRFNLARARGLTGDWAGAVGDYQKANDLFPDDHVTLYNLALALQKASRPEEALPVLERVATLRPDDPSFLLTLGLAYEGAHRPEDAVAAYTRFLEISPEAADSAAVKARLTRLQGVGTVPGALPGGVGPARSLSGPVGHGPA